MLQRWILVACSLSFILSWSLLAASEKEIVFEVDNALGVANALKRIGFYDLKKHPERLRAVPRTQIWRLPSKTDDLWREDIGLRKTLFFRLALSATLQVNEQIMAKRKRLLGLSVQSLDAADRSWVSSMMARYRVAKAEAPPTPKGLRELIDRVDTLPPSLVLAQGAIESGWAQSRFAREGQAVFGQWTTSRRGIKALRSKVRVAAFKNPRASLVAYMLNLNSHAAYAGFRKARAELRRKGKPLNGYFLAGYLRKYAETGKAYVKLVRTMIRRDDLTRFDSAKLRPGPIIIFRKIEKN